MNLKLVKEATKILRTRAVGLITVAAKPNNDMIAIYTDEPA
jgi:hypothetical protein